MFASCCGYGRKSDGPSMSIVYFIPTDDGRLLVSTMGARSKARVVARNPKVSLCVLDERWPFAYLQVYADAVVETDPEVIVDVMMAVGGRMSGVPLGEEVREFVAAMAKEEGRVVLRCRPYETFALPPRHLQRQRPGRAGHPLGFGGGAVGRRRPGVTASDPSLPAASGSGGLPAESAPSCPEHLECTVHEP